MTSRTDARTPETPPQRMSALGQAIWLRGLRRRLVESGRLSELTEQAALTGVCMDAVVLAGAIERGAEYAEPLAELVGKDSSDRLLQGLLAREASIIAAELQAVYEATGGADGLVGVEADPSLAHDAERLARVARRLLNDAGAANAMATLPPTTSGLAVFETLVADRLHALIGPFYTVRSLLRAADAFARATAGMSPDDVPTAVASFGVAPLDALIDQFLGREIRGAGRDMSGVESLLGSAGIATAKVAWRRQAERFTHEAASRMRIAWTDLSSADPRLPREHYVERLIGPGTIALLDGPLLSSLMRRGRVEPTLGRHVDEAEEVLAELADLGIETEEIGTALEAKAVRQARGRYSQLLDRVEVAIEALADDPAGSRRRVATGSSWSAHAVEIADRLADCEELERRRAAVRLWGKDASLWSEDEATQELIRNRLGWLDAAASNADDQDRLLGFAAELEAGEVESVVLVGMGGSSLAAEVCRNVFRSKRLRVLDSTVPEQIRAVGDAVDPARTAILVASKSGTTIEVRALLDWFYALATPMLDKPGERFAAITDPGTPLEQLALERGFSRLWLAPPDVGGRFSALTVFGTLPMALMGIDVPAVSATARRMASACSPETTVSANPAVRLATALYDAAERGRDKITFVTPSRLAAFPLWAEQLIAESTGKQGRGLIPVVDEPGIDPEAYGEDRLFVAISLQDAGDEYRRRLDDIEGAGHPLLRFELEDRHDLGAEFFRWEAAIALLGALMDINPFDQPDVQSSKDRTAALLDAHRQGKPMSERQPLATDTGWALFADLESDEDLARRQRGDDLANWLAAHLGRAAEPEYVGIQAFLAPRTDVRDALQELRKVLLERLGVTTTLGWGPAFLHSTGQLHKGGPDSGIFLQLTADESEDIEVPGAGYSFGQLVRAQSLGDLAALQEGGRRIMRVHVRDAASGCRAIVEAAEEGIDQRKA